MKRALFVLFIVIAAIGYLSAGAIKVYYPETGSKVKKTGSANIKWRITGIMDERVKIRLFDSTGSIRVASIVDDAPNNGYYEWRNRSGIADGNYVVVVRTKDNLTSGQSGVFFLGNGTPVFKIEPVGQVKLLVTKPDFEVMDIYLHDANVLRVVIRNIGNVWTGKLELKCGIGNRNFRFSVNNGNPKRYAKNHVSDMRIPEFVTQSDVSCPNPKVLLVARVDPDNKIAELNEKNNVKSIMYPHNLGPDYIIKGVSILANEGKLCLRIKNQGTANRGPLKLKVVDAATNGSKLNLLIDRPYFIIPAGQEKLVYMGAFNYSRNFGVKAKIISGQFNCESIDKRNNNNYEGLLGILHSAEYKQVDIYY